MAALNQEPPASTEITAGPEAKVGFSQRTESLHAPRSTTASCLAMVLPAHPPMPWLRLGLGFPATPNLCSEGSSQEMVQYETSGK